jgi:probable phosphoglycerate mutase
MTAGRLVIWRHGQTAYNLAGRIQGNSDIALDTTGVEQAAAAAVQIAQLKPDAVWSSDLIRARATAEALAELTGLPIQTDPRLRERKYGRWEGLAARDIKARWPEEFQRWRAGEEIPEIGMETRRQAGLRGAACIADAVGGLPDDSTLVVTAHGGVSTCAITILLGLDPAVWLGLRGMDNAHWALLQYDDTRTPEWHLMGYNLN